MEQQAQDQHQGTQDDKGQQPGAHPGGTPPGEEGGCRQIRPVQDLDMLPQALTDGRQKGGEGTGKSGIQKVEAHARQNGADKYRDDQLFGIKHGYASFHENGPGALYGASKKLCRCRRIIHEKEGEIRNENFLDRGGVPWI